MKATGIVRRIDDLGRVVIPRDIRAFMNLSEGDPLEVFVDNEGNIMFRKYNDHQDFDTKIQEAYSWIVGSIYMGTEKGNRVLELLKEVNFTMEGNECI